jgi:hypothetical protein
VAGTHNSGVTALTSQLTDLSKQVSGDDVTPYKGCVTPSDQADTDGGTGVIAE